MRYEHQDDWRFKLMLFVYENFSKILLTAFSLFVAYVELSAFLANIPWFNEDVVLMEGVSTSKGAISEYIVLAILLFANVHLWLNDATRSREIKLYKGLLLSSSPAEDKLNVYLAHLSKRRFNFGHSHRVSIYKYDKDLKCFFRVARHCQRVDWSDGGHRESYLSDKGIISKVWKDEDFKIKGLPDREKNFYGYSMELDREGVGLPDDVLKKMRMPSRSYCGFKVHDPNEPHSLGVIIFESTKPNGLKYRRLKRFMHSSEGKLLAQLTESRKLTQNDSEVGLWPL
ncbi:MAG: hypothetical protein MRY32_02765 [Rickettsiales bacterium]|nr:hypothetical protein [Rickettsiales bacterium]